ncbi:rRNA-processing protein EBP2 [Psilocybe cubensis]|uniref:rRNA-processing protein EBP2 n=2 Tax=Psilocybe cubensis TaxID=181762 RepID=A0ACB8GY85_PSICU|nr:rRNA-processing protein EBP2 [Psilocybe cubensis]KAH9480708.1 rRNA-processing protein EBP2 [Psilocybe cubensis]
MPSTVKAKPSKSTVPKADKAKKEAKVKAPKSTSKAVEKAPSPPPPAPEPVEEPEESEEEDSDDDDDDEGVDEEGMARLMQLLGDDALDDFGKAQLEALSGGIEGEDDDEDEDWTSEEEGDEEGESGSDNDEDEDLEVDAEELEALSGEEEGNSEDEEEEEAVPLDEIDEDLDEDVVPRQKIEIDNKVALDQIRESIQLDPSLPWTETLVLNYPQTIDVDVNDDLNRELAFYKQALHGANAARALAAKHNFPFTRPADYFAEMIKSDSHMERIRQRLLNESAGIKKSEDKRKEREGKKFGKQVQVEKLKEREKSKKEMEEKLKGLKRKRKDILDNPGANDDEFDIAVEDAIADRPAKRGKGSNGKSMSRSARDSKFGFGGATRHSKSNTRESTDDFGPGRGRGRGRGGFGGRGGRGGGGAGRGGSKGGRGGFGGKSRGGGTKRLGKSRRAKS